MVWFHKSSLCDDEEVCSSLKPFEIIKITSMYLRFPKVLYFIKSCARHFCITSRNSMHKIRHYFLSFLLIFSEFLTEMKFRIPMMCWSMIFTDISRYRVGGEGVGGNPDHNWIHYKHYNEVNAFWTVMKPFIKEWSPSFYPEERIIWRRGGILGILAWSLFA